jgi:hypothetical protein
MSEHEFSLRNNHPQFGGKISVDPYDVIKGKQIQGSWGGGSTWVRTQVPLLNYI